MAAYGFLTGNKVAYRLYEPFLHPFFPAMKLTGLKM
jgi:hypothetical protein